MLAAFAIVLATSASARTPRAVGAPLVLDKLDRNVTRAVAVAIAGMNVRIGHYCRSQGAIEEWKLISAATEVQADSLAYELDLMIEGHHPVTAHVALRESTGKMVFVSSVPYCCSVRASSLANRQCDVEKHNADPSRTYDQAVYKMFQGRTLASLARQYLGLRTHPREWDSSALSEPLEKGLSAPDEYDFRTANPSCKLPPRDQGSCGSCWAQSNSGMMEDRLCKATGGELRVRLSVQQHVSCNTLCLPRPNSDLCQAGCDGGFQDLSGAYLELTGLVEDSTLPYSSGGSGSYEDHFGASDSAGSCPNSKLAQHPHFKAEAKSTRMLRGSSDMMHEISHNGPLDVAMTVYNDFWNYKRGVYSSNPSSGMAGGHAVKMIGYGIENGVPYWTCQNSWGTGWGEGGYFRARRGDKIGLEESAWVVKPIVPNVAVIENEAQPPPPPPPEADKCPKSGRAARRCRRSKANGASSSSSDLGQQFKDTIAYHFKRFFGFDTGPGNSGGPPIAKALLRAPGALSDVAQHEEAELVALVVTEKGRRRRSRAGAPAPGPTPTPVPEVPATTDAAVNGFVQLLSEPDNKVIAMEPFVDVDGRMAIDKSQLAPGVYRIALCDKDGLTCEVEDDKLHVASCPMRDGYECGGHGRCHVSGHSSRGKCVCEEGYAGASCHPQCPKDKQLYSGCSVRSGIWDTDSVSTIGTPGDDALYSLSVHSACTLTLSTCHTYTNFDTKLSIYDGCPLGDSGVSAPLASNDDNCSIAERGTASTLTVELDPGRYTVHVEGLDAHDIGSFELSAFGCGAPGEEVHALSTSSRHHRHSHAHEPHKIEHCPPDEPRDAAANVCLLTARELRVGDKLSAHLSGREGLYVITPQRDVTVEFSTCGSKLDTQLQIFHGCPHRGGHLMSQSDDECGSGSYTVVKLDKGVDYYVLVQGYEGETGVYELRATEANDLCWGSELVAPVTITQDEEELNRMGAERAEIVTEVKGDTCFQTSIVPPHTSPDMVYVFSVAVPTDIDVYTCAADGVTNFDTVLRLRSDCYYEARSVEMVHAGLDSLEPTCAPGEMGAAFYAPLPPGNYSLEVTSGDAQCGSYRLHLGFTPAPPDHDGTSGDVHPPHHHREKPVVGPPPSSNDSAVPAAHVDHPPARTRHGCTCLENWDYKSVLYHDCDPNQPNAHGAWCPVNEKGCGKMLHHSNREALKHPTATGYWDWCTPPHTHKLRVESSADAPRSALQGGSGALAGALAALCATLATALVAAWRYRVVTRAAQSAQSLPEHGAQPHAQLM